MTGPVMYVHRPTRKPAFQYDGTNGLEIALWATDKAYVTDRGDLVIVNKQGEFAVAVGDFVVRGREGEFYPCPPDLHAAEYEPVGEG